MDKAVISRVATFRTYMPTSGGVLLAGLVTIVLSLPPLLWFYRNWMLNADAAFYLSVAANLATGQGYTTLGNEIVGFRGPVLPGMLSLLVLLFGRNPYRIVDAVRIIELLDPFIAFLLLRKVGGTAVGLVTAALIAFFGYIATTHLAFTPDAIMMIPYLLSLWMLLVAIHREDVALAASSGVLLGIAILTKETAFTGVPLALITALVFGFRLRLMIAHYFSLGIVCLAWWLWLYLETGKIFLLQAGEVHLISSLGAWEKVLVAIGVVFITAIIMTGYATGLFTAFMQRTKIRVTAGWVIAIAYSAVMSAVVLSARVTPKHWTKYGADTISYLRGEVLSQTPLWFLLPLAVGFLLWRVARRDRNWTYLLIILLLWIPIPLLLILLRYNVRQWLVPETLYYGALAGAIVHLVLLALSRSRIAVRAIASVATLLVAIAVGYATITQFNTLQGVASARDQEVWNETNASVYNMHEWLAQNIPAGTTILSTRNYTYALSFLDETNHDYRLLILPDEKEGLSKHQLVARASCALHGKSKCKESMPTYLSFTTSKTCDSSYISTQNTVEPMLQTLEKTHAKYLLLTQPVRGDNVSSLGSQLRQSGAFSYQHASYLDIGGSFSEKQGLYLLRFDGPLKVSGLTVNMLPSDFDQLSTCLKKQLGKNYAVGFRSLFPNGINILKQSKYSQAMRAQVNEIYSGK